MKATIQGVLRRCGLLERLQASWLYDLYWLVADRRLLASRSTELRFYRNLLQDMKKGALVYDVGANDGSKTDILLRLGAKVVAVEPDAHNQAVIKRRFLRYRVVKKPVIVIGKALSDQNAMETMWVDGDGSALNTLSQKWVNSLQSDQTRFGHTV